jgi:hypothetical protein
MGQGLNRYRYGWNSPTNFTDPSGHWEVGLAPPSMGRMAGSVGMASVTGPMGDGGLGAALGRGFADGLAKKKPTREELDKYRWGKDLERTCTGARKNHPWCKERYGRSGGRGGGGGGGGRRCADGDTCGGEDGGGIEESGDVVDELLAEFRRLLEDDLWNSDRNAMHHLVRGQLEELVRGAELGKAAHDRDLSPAEKREATWLAVKSVATIGLFKLAKAGKVVPRAGAVLRPTGDVAVYEAVDASGRTIYVGITKNFVARAAAHLRRGLVIQRIRGLTGLARSDARAAEQVLIEAHGLSKNGGTLWNEINSIAQSNPKYAEAVARGKELLRQAGYPGF